MPVLLLGMGVFAVVAGLVMIGFGIPINEFSFGNTLISAGTTAAVGGLVIIAVGIAVGQLRRIAGMLAEQGLVQGMPVGRFPLPPDEPEAPPVTRRASSAQPAQTTVQATAQATPQTTATGANGSRPPYPARGKEKTAHDPFAVEPEPAMDDHPDQFAPSLRNPDEAPVPVDDDVSLSPRHPQGAPSPVAMSPGALDRTSDSFDWRVPPPAANAPAASSAPSAPLRPQPANFDAIPAARPQPANFDAIPAARPQPANFDAMWPAEGKLEAKVAKTPSASGGPAAASGAAVRPRAEPQMPGRDVTKDAAKPRTVAVLKSGVVDGMGYTLYVDGSIEAELPQGTLRFASINELRSHLEKNS